MATMREPVWPAVIQIEGDPELVFVRDRSAWQSESATLAASPGDQDRLIDSIGQQYRPIFGANGETSLLALDEAMSLDEVLGLVKAHAAQADSCCVAKLWAPTIREAFQIVETFAD